jgi:hypothetical protein
LTLPAVPPLVGLGVVVVDAWLGYGRFMILANRMARAAVRLFPPRDIPFFHGLAIAVMPSWCAIQVAVYLLLAWTLDLPLRTLFGERFDWTLIPRGILLGVAEASFSMVLATVALRVLAPLRQAQRGGDAALEYQTLGQSGWMRSYLYVFARLPLPLALLVVMLPLLGEELIFRATAIPLLLPLGVVPAVALSTLMFAAVQVLWLPSWYQAIGPVCGALVMGVCNGLLFAHEGNLLPLLIAHVVFLGMLIDPARFRDA